MRKLLVLLLCVLLCASGLVGCASPDSSGGGKSAKDTSGGAVASEEDLSPITFTVFAKDLDPNYENFESLVAKEITKRTGVTLKMEYPVGDLVQKIGIMIASEDYPDIIFVADQLPKFIEADAIIPLDDMIESSGENVKKLYGNYLNRLRFSNADPTTYMLGTYGVDDAMWKPSIGFEIQHAAVQDASYPDIKTLADAEKIIADYVAKNPTINGQPTIGLSLIADDWRWQSGIGNTAAAVSGIPVADGNWYIDPETYEAGYRFGMDSQKVYFQWLNHMNDIGLLDPESFVQKYDHYAAKISSGRVVALNDQDWQYRDAEKVLESNEEYDKTYGMYPVQANDTTTSMDFIDKGYAGGWGVAITKNCKDPERAFQFLDWLCSDEAQVLNSWGIEGENYTMEDGKRVISDDEWNRRTSDPNYRKETGVGMYLYPFPMRGRGVEDSTGNLYNPETEDSIKSLYNPVAKEVLAAYDAELWRDLFPTAKEIGRSDPWGMAWQIPIPDEGNMSVIITKLLDVTKQYIAKSVLATPEEFDAVWDEFQAELKAAGMEEANANFTRLVKDRVALWEGK